MHAAGTFVGNEQPGDYRRASIRVDFDNAHDVVTGGTDFYWLRGDVDIGELHELVMH